MSARARLLIVKTSSLGDVVHALPAVTDIVAAHPDWDIDWVCEESFAGIPRLHPGVTRVIPCAVRRWRRSWWAASTRGEVFDFRKALHTTAYDAVVDLQGLLKSAWITRQARGRHHGYDWRSAREPLSTLAYDARYRVAWGQHAIARNRQLAAAALGYRTDAAPGYGIEPQADSEMSTAPPFAVALHATSRPDKLWPESEWNTLLAALTARGLRVVLPWGNDAERERSARLAANLEGATVPQRTLPEALAALFANARIVVGVDTGLVHLAVAAGAPTLALFGPTNPALTGVIGERAPAINLGGNGTFPDFSRVDEQVGQLLGATRERDAAGRLGL